jgi:hypothetical protein
VRGGEITWADDLRVAFTSYGERGRWPAFSARAPLMRRAERLWASSWQQRGEAARAEEESRPSEPALVRCERQVFDLLVGIERPSASVRLATVVALESVRTGRTPGAIAPLLDAIEAGVMAYWPRSGGLAVAPRPGMLIENGELHCWDGRPAVRWESGRCLWFWRGVHMTERIGGNPGTLTASRIRATRNAERRRVMLERHGYAHYLRDVGAELVSQDDFGTLWRSRGVLGAGSEELVLVEVVNSTPEHDGSHRRYFLRVPPDCRTARQAVAWTFGFANETDYLIAAES